MDTYESTITPAVSGPYSATTTYMHETLSGGLESQTLIHVQHGKLRYLVAVVTDHGDGGAPVFDYNPDNRERVAAFHDYLARAYPDADRWAREEYALAHMLRVEAGLDA